MTPTLPFSTLVIFPLVYFEQAADGQILGGLLCPRSLSLHEVT